MTYSDKLKHPKWQKKRLEILQMDEFECRHCESKEKTLHIHHLKYTGNNPWDAPDNDLITLCHECHELESKENYRKNLEALCKAIDICNFTSYELALMKKGFDNFHTNVNTPVMGQFFLKLLSDDELSNQIVCDVMHLYPDEKPTETWLDHIK